MKQGLWASCQKIYKQLIKTFKHGCKSKEKSSLKGNEKCVAVIFNYKYVDHLHILMARVKYVFRNKKK